MTYNMKQYKLTAIVSVLLLSFCSCSDFLDRYPLEELSDGSFWKQPLDAEMFVAQIYNALPSDDIDSDIESDNATHGIKWAAGNVSRGIYDPLDMSWEDEYKYIRMCNLLMEKIDEIPNYAQADKEATIAEARFLRGFVYFGLIRSFGDVPWVESTLTLDQLTDITRTPRADVYNNVMEDLDYAIAKLPAEWPAAKYGRATKYAAYAIKARAALYFGNWQVAADASQAIMSSNKYGLFDAEGTGRYAELFWESEEKTNEAILVRQFSYPDLGQGIIGWGAFPTQGWGGINPTQSLVDAFECIDGAPIAQSSLYNPRNPFENRDPRLEVCVLHDGETMYGDLIKVAPLKSAYPTGIGQHGDATATGYYNQKYLDPSVDPQEEGWDGGKDWHVVRYAEVLLTYAEAKNELSGLDASALDAVNQVRKRAGIPALQTTDAKGKTYVASQDDLRQRIRNEWRVEYAMEGAKRMWDIRRWGIAKTVLNAPFEGLTYQLVDSPDADPADGGKICILYVDRNAPGAKVAMPTQSAYKENNYLFPVPQSQIDLNPNLTQNPGY